MAKLFTVILALLLFLGLPQAGAQAEGLTSLQPCGDLPAFTQRLDDRLGELEAKLASTEPNSPQSLVIERKIQQTTKRFDGYSTMLCGEDGLPRLMTDGRLNHANEFILPGLAFLYIAGWLGWAGRIYLITIRETEKDPALKESTIDVPLAVKCFAAALIWPLAAFKEIASGEIRVADDAVPISPR